MQAGLRWAMLVALVLCAQGAAATPSHFPTTVPVRFVLLGDTGTGESSQYAVATALETVCAQRGCAFAIEAGDNIYEYGASSDHDPQFQEKFELPYAKLDFPFFMALGNHDQSGVIPGSGVYPAKGDYQVHYTQRSKKWMMPARYYKFGVPFAKPNDFNSQVTTPIIEFFALDTCDLAPQNMPQFDWYRPGRKYDLDQRKWLREGLAGSTANWKVVFAHHPYVNNGKHGNAGQFFGLGLAKGEELKKMYEEEVCGKADFLVAGHDHSLQWLEAQPSCGDRPQFIVTGTAGHFDAPVSGKRPNPFVWEAFGTLGFFWAEATADKLTLAAYTVSEKGVATLAFERTLQR